ncbi:MAG TPA: DUF3427 domain-containing protein, partial [Gemmatimonadaceae bacterium]|nr:DUF3427 domain-containing protein [Gemmatimonadaceae bacterium]
AEGSLSRRIGWLTHVDDPAQLAFIRRVAESPGTYTVRSEGERVRLRMLAYQMALGQGAVASSQIVEELGAYPACASELVELADVLNGRTRMVSTTVPGLADTPLSLWCAYTRNEVLAATGYFTDTVRPAAREGVIRLRDRRCELLFVTLDKSSGFHETVKYKDYAISPGRFHWQTQNNAGPENESGRRYIESATNGWQFQLFVRSTRDDPFRACGPVRVADPSDITGDRPMSITWTLDVPLPARLFGEFSVLRG